MTLADTLVNWSVPCAPKPHFKLSVQRSQAKAVSMSHSCTNPSRRRFVQFAAASAVLPFTRVRSQRADLVPITMQAAWLNDAESAGYLTAMAHNFYAQGGVALNYLAGGPGIDPVMSLVSGTAHVALARPDSVARAMTEHDIALKIIGAQYQKSPLGIVSLARNPIAQLSDLIGKRLAVAPFNLVYVNTVLDLHGIDRDQVSIVPYTYDSAQLINGECDACVDWTTKLPYRIHLAGIDSHALLFYDLGLTLFDNVVVTTAETQESRRDDLAAWMIASRQGWQHNRTDPVAAVNNLLGSYFENSESVRERETFYNLAQIDLMEAEHGFFAMSNAGIQDTIDALALLGHSVPRDVFDSSVLGLAMLSMVLDDTP